MKFSQNDLKIYAAFKRVIESGNFEIKGNAIVSVAFLLNWFNDLPVKIQAAVKIDSINEKKIIEKPIEEKKKTRKKAK